MARGGPRPGAGRPKGSTGKKGSKNKAVTNGTLKVLTRGDDGDPLDLLVKVSDNVRVPLSMRVDAASKALPYLRPRLSSTEMVGDLKDAKSPADLTPKQVLALVKDRSA